MAGACDCDCDCDCARACAYVCVYLNYITLGISKSVSSVMDYVAESRSTEYVL